MSGQVAVGSYILQMGDVNGGIVNFAAPSEKPTYSRRPSPVKLRPRAFPSLLNREAEFASARTALQGAIPVSIYGEEGIGKTSFVRQLTHLLDTDGFPHGVVYLDSPAGNPDDLLQSLFDAFYESLPEFKPTPTQIRHALRDLNAVIFLDDLNLETDEVLSLLNSAPNSLFVVSSLERALWGEGQLIPMRGLSETYALALFEREVGHPISEEERKDAHKIVGLLKGHPLHILQAASLIREKSWSVGETLEALLEEAPEIALFQAALSTLIDEQKRSLAILAAAGGTAIPIEHLSALSQDTDARKTLRGLIALGLVQAQSPRYSLIGDLATRFDTLWDLSAREDALINYFVRWLEEGPARELVEESAEVLLYVVRKADEKARWPELIRLGRALEPYLILWKRWQAWAELLNLILKAAQTLGDRALEAWALHQ
ncbi:MAG TPA: AAA family ATPase, partial [Anaerolineales bacterium]|nr:AAA family ATPase [Anaerolineales bacterium]